MKPARKSLFLSATLNHVGICAGIVGRQDWRRRRTLRPFTSKVASGKWVDREIDAMDGRYAEMKEKCNLVETARDGTIPALTVNKIDVIMPSLAITEKRKETMGFSSAYYTPAAILMGAR